MVLVMRGLLNSPRRRRRAAILAALVLAGGLATLIGFLLTNTAEPQKETFERGQAQVTKEQKPRPLSAADRRAVLAVVHRFVDAGVARKDLPAAFDLSTPNFHGGLTRAQWVHGETPIYPYPVYRHGARIAESYQNDVMVQLYLRARSRSVEPLGVDVELKAVGRGTGRRWLVDYYQPRETLATAGSRARSGPEPKDPGLGPHLTQRWLLVPLGILLLIVLVPVGLGLRDWLAGRAAEREQGEGRRLPPLPSRSRRER